MKMMYVICFYWVGDRWSSKEKSAEVSGDRAYQNHLRRVGEMDNKLACKYITNLYRAVKRFANRPFKFICFTNEQIQVDSEIDIRPFYPVTTKGVLPRMWVFSKEAGLFGHQVLCLDLDVILVGSLELLMNYNGLFCARSKFRKGEQHKLDGDVFSFKAGEETENQFWVPFVRNVEEAERETQGRERYWFRHVAEQTADRWDIVAPGALLSYKWHVRSKNKEAVSNASIVSCHGFPRPHQVKEDWLKELWNYE